VVSLAFVHESRSSFILQDLEILSAIMPVKAVRWSNVTKIGMLLRAVMRSDITFIWFSSGQAATIAFVLARIFGKKVIAVAGGSEVCPDKDIHGSGLRSAIRFLLTRIILSNSDYVIPVSEFTKREVLAISSPRNLSVVHHGIDTDWFRPDDRKDSSILTVAAGRTWDQVGRKGLDRFAKLAGCLPERRFIIVGEAAAKPQIRKMFPENVRITGKVSKSILTSYYQRARFYCQLSRHEGFGVAVAEAMACKCVPVVSDSGALPEVVGECGVVVPDGDPAKSAKAIEELWDHCEELGESARYRVRRLYSVEQRVSGFKAVLSDVGCL